jgi:hypothetical protein
MGRRDARRRMLGLVTVAVMSVLQPALACSALCVYHSLPESGVSHASTHQHEATCPGPMMSPSGARVASVSVGVPLEQMRLAVPGTVATNWHVPYASARREVYSDHATPPPRA